MSGHGRGMRVTLVALACLAATVSRAEGTPAPRGGTIPGPPSGNAPAPEPAFESPYHHGRMDGLAYGGNIELRFAEDRVRGVSDPEWFSVGSVGGFVSARIHPRVQFLWKAAWDRGADDFSVESAYLDVRMGGAMHGHAGIFLSPLGGPYVRQDAPRNEFDERSLVATQLIGVPNPQLGVGIFSVSRAGKGLPLSYEIDLVTGYDDGLIMESPGGTRVAHGRNNYGDNNGMPALAARLAILPSRTTEIGLAGQSGMYNETEVGGVTVDGARYAHVIAADGAAILSGIRLAGEAAVAMIDVPPGLGTLYAERQWGVSAEAARVLFEPLFKGWRTSSLTIAVRADAVDFDRAILGDSRSRLSASLNIRPRAAAVLRLGWYYEIMRDRFNNTTPVDGLTLSAASYF